jgi:hypothetical protein
MTMASETERKDLVEAIIRARSVATAFTNPGQI